MALLKNTYSILLSGKSISIHSKNPTLFDYYARDDRDLTNWIPGQARNDGVEMPVVIFFDQRSSGDCVEKFLAALHKVEQ